METIVRVFCKIIFLFLGIYTCDYLVVMCSDFRFDRGNRKLRRAENISCADEIKIPGSIMSIIERNSLVMEWLLFFYEKHKIKTIYLVTHANCGWCAEHGASFENNDGEEQLYHKDQLRMARQIVNELLPEVKVSLRYARLSPNRRLIEYIEVV